MEQRLIEAWLRIFIEPGQVTELRALNVKDRGYTCTKAGFFDYDHLGVMASIAAEITPNASGVYFVPNPVDKELLARCANRIDDRAKSDMFTSDKDIVLRRWFLIDADPVRKSGISSTDEEKAAALAVIEKACDVVCRMPEIIQVVMADSGNGYHLLCRWKNVNDPEDVRIVKALLGRLAKTCDTDAVKIDRKVFNPSRIVKLYGTISRKGDHTNERPHRCSSVMGEWK